MLAHNPRNSGIGTIINNIFYKIEERETKTLLWGELYLEQDMKILGEWNLNKLVVDGELYRKLGEKDKAHKGLCGNYDEDDVKFVLLCATDKYDVMNL